MGVQSKTSPNGGANGAGRRADDGLSHDATEATPLVDAVEDGPGSRAPAEVWDGLRDFEDLAWWRQPSIFWLLGPFGVLTLAFGGSIVPKINLILNLVCTRYYSERQAGDPDGYYAPILLGGDNPQCFDPDVQREVAMFTLITSILTGGLSALSAPKLGSLSDRYGRTTLMAMCSLGGVVTEIITILAATFPQTVSYYWLILGAICDGVSGSFTAGSILSHAYVSDCTAPSGRNVAYGYLHACLNFGMAFGPLLVAWLMESTGSLLSIFYIALGCHVFWIGFVALALPESLSKRRQRMAREKFEAERVPPRVPRALGAAMAHVPGGKTMSEFITSLCTTNPLSPLRVLLPKGESTALRRNLVTLALVDMGLLSALSSGTVMLLYVEYMFGWRTAESSRFMSLMSTVRVAVLLAVLPVINHFFGSRRAGRAARSEKNAGADGLDVWLLRVALMSDIIGAVGYIFARDPTVFIICGMFTAFGGLGSATIQAALTKHVPAERVGQLLGAVGLLHALSRIMAPLLFNGTYAVTVKTFPQAFFVLSTTVFGFCLAGSLVVKTHVYASDGTEEDPCPVSVPVSGLPRSNSAVRNALEDDQSTPH